MKSTLFYCEIFIVYKVFVLLIEVDQIQSALFALGSCYELRVGWIQHNW